MTQKLKCAWLSRHRPTPEQIRSLADYEIVQVCRRFKDAQEAWEAANEGGKPAIIMAVLPLDMLYRLLALAGDVPIMRTHFIVPTNGGPARWSGLWTRVRKVEINAVRWSPQEYAQRALSNREGQTEPFRGSPRT